MLPRLRRIAVQDEIGEAGLYEQGETARGQQRGSLRDFHRQAALRTVYGNRSFSVSGSVTGIWQAKF